MIHDVMKMVDRLSMKVGKTLADTLNLHPNLTIELFGPDGKLKERRRVRNTVTTAGKNGAAAQLLAAPDIVKPGWMELGTGSPAATLLGAYILNSRTALDSKTRSDNVITMICTFAAGVGTGAVTEAGVFNVVTQNTVDMYLSASFAVVNKLAADSMVMTWTFTFN